MEKIVKEKVEKNGKTETVLTMDHFNPEDWSVQNGIELVINLGNFSSLRLISYRRGQDSESVQGQIFSDLFKLKEEFLKNAEELCG